MTLRTLISCLFVLISSVSHAQEWTRFRGPNGSGVTEAKGIPAKVTPADYKWRVELPGAGHSQPVLWGDRIFVSSAPKEGGKRILSCHRVSDGGELWAKEFESSEYHNHRLNNFASSTPVVDAERVYVAFAHPKSGFIVCLDHDGKLKWERDLGRFASQHGFGMSPMLHGEVLVMPYEQLEEGSFVFAFDKKTGAPVWKTERPSRRSAYGTPCVLKDGKGKEQLVLTSGANGVYALNPTDGKVLWGADVFDKRSVSSPILAGGLIFGTCGSGGGGNYLVAVRPGGAGDVTATHVQYRIRQSMPYVPTGIAHGGRLYLWSDKGVVTCVKPESGDVIWKERVDGAFSGSPIWADGKLYCMSHDGELVVIAAADKFKLLGRSDLGELSRSTPAVAGGQMYLRTESHLIAIGTAPNRATGGS